MKRLRFGLKTLFALVTVLGILCGWFVFKVNEAGHQKRVVEEIRRMGSVVEYECDLEEPPRGLAKWRIDTFGKDFCCYAVEVKAGHPVFFDDLKLDRLIPLLKQLPKLEHLNLAFTDISNEHLKELTSLHSLKTLDLDFTKATKDTVDELQAALPTTTITSQGLE